MRQLRFYQPNITENSTVPLSDAAHHQAGRVLRLRAGAAIELVSGDGRNYPAVIKSISRQKTVVETGSAEDNPVKPALSLHLHLALLKGEAMDWALQKAVELGATAVTPLVSAHSERKLEGERLSKKMAHWQGIFIASALQCGRSEWPVLQEPAKAGEAPAAADINWIFSPHDVPAKAPEKPVKSAAVMIGPEGGFTEEEVQAAVTAGWQPRLLGPRILRADTAAAAALCAVQLRYGDWTC